MKSYLEELKNKRKEAITPEAAAAFQHIITLLKSRQTP